THGHAAGDAVLAAAARQLQQGLRNTDLVARFGGEEFIAVLPERDAQRAAEIAERLRARMEELRVEFEGRELGVTASFGIAALAGGDAWSELLRRADHALYEAKRAGRNCLRGEGMAVAPAPAPAKPKTVRITA
ncbi:MAG: GGDEF domain-containing protein, partial [Streptosporangiaceae bacterium]